jgi:hypothetical protein
MPFIKLHFLYSKPDIISKISIGLLKAIAVFDLGLVKIIWANVLAAEI